MSAAAPQLDATLISHIVTLNLSPNKCARARSFGDKAGCIVFTAKVEHWEFNRYLDWETNRLVVAAQACECPPATGSRNGDC
jgi:hypothetical protein